MLDAVDKVIRSHIGQLLFVKGRPVSVFSIATAEENDQPFTQAGMANKPDKIDLPFAGLVRLPDIDITDDNVTKRVHNYTGCTLFPDSLVRLTYYRATLHYGVVIFAETRKISEDLATQLFIQLRNNCQVDATIQLPIRHPDYPEKFVGVQMNADIVMGPQIQQVQPQSLTKAQIYKCRVLFELQNVNIYDFVEDHAYTYNVFVTAKSSRSGDGVTEGVGPQELT